ncbi:Neuronal acetylcholine receptor subunit alpha-9-like 2, partial [Homarus americanus]
MVFSLPAESGEKIGLGINSMLAMMVFLMAMTENLPPTENLPLAGVYYGACISMITMNIALSVTVLNLNVMGLRGYQVPDVLKIVTLFVAKVIVVRIPIIVRESWGLEDNVTVTVTPEQNINETINVDGSLVKVFTVQPQKPSEFPKKEPEKKHLDDDLDSLQLTDPFQRKAIAALESINRILTREETERNKVNKKSNLVEQWKFVSRVMDRTLFISFTIITFSFNVAILTSSPFRQSFAYCPLGENGECDDLTWQDITELTNHAASGTHFAQGDQEDSPWGGAHGAASSAHLAAEVAYDGFDDPLPQHDHGGGTYSTMPRKQAHGALASSAIIELHKVENQVEHKDQVEDHSSTLITRGHPN